MEARLGKLQKKNRFLKCRLKGEAVLAHLLGKI